MQANKIKQYYIFQVSKYMVHPKFGVMLAISKQSVTIHISLQISDEPDLCIKKAVFEEK